MSAIKFQKGSIKFNKKSATLKIPLSLAKQLYEKAGGDCETYISVIQGIMQISPRYPDTTIPSILLEKEYFVQQKA